jgi:hypothetical protein
VIETASVVAGIVAFCWWRSRRPRIVGESLERSPDDVISLSHRACNLRGDGRNGTVLQ